LWDKAVRDCAAGSDGPQAAARFVAGAQRLSYWLSAQTGQGADAEDPDSVAFKRKAEWIARGFAAFPQIGLQLSVALGSPLRPVVVCIMAFAVVVPHRYGES